MWKLRIGAFLTTGLVALSLSAAAQAGSGGPNAGDVWVDNVGEAAGPGHEMDPHLACAPINLWGSGLTDASGSFTVDGWPPSGPQEQDYAGDWTYSANSSADQVMAVIDVNALINQAEANGEVPAAQGFHFKLQFTQDPQKHKTFWLVCTPSSSGGGGGDNGGGGNNGGGGSNGGGGDNGGGGTNNGGGDSGGNDNDGGGSGGGGTTNTTTTPTTSQTATSASIGAATAARQTHHKRHHKRHQKKHRKLRRHRVRAVRVRLPTFTG